MTTLAELNAKTDQLFKEQIKVPNEYNNDGYKEALKSLNLEGQIKFFDEQTRYRKAQKCGLAEVTVLEAIEMMVGESVKILQRRECKTEFHNMHFAGQHNVEKYGRLTCSPEQWVVQTSNGNFQYQVGDPDYLKSKIPYGVLLRMQELRKLDTFDAFFAVAPLEMWRPGVAIPRPDPIMLASVIMPIRHTDTFL